MMHSERAGTRSDGSQVGSAASSSRTVRTDSMSGSVYSLISEAIYDRPSLLQVLALAQKLGIAVVPTTWNPNLGRLGEGTTAHVNQNLVSVQTSFAFKNTKGPLDSSFKALMCELAVLGHPLVQKNPNVSQLLGICWEYCSDQDVRPVLVFEKLSPGNLKKFMTSSQGIFLTTQRRLSVCADIATAILSMHQYGIIHGDLRPENILVSLDDQTGDVTAKITDFGFSTTLFGDQTTIDLAMTMPWADPEIDPKGQSFLDAKKSDIYSLGLVSLWTLLHRHQESDPYSAKPYSWVEDSLKGQSLASVTQRGIEALDGISSAGKTSLWQFWEASVFICKQERTSDLRSIISHLGDHCHPGATAPLTGALNLTSAAASDFQVAKSLISFVSARYALREHIYKCLLEEYDNFEHDAVAFNLAFCHTIGFGTRANSEKAAAFRERSGKTRQDIEKLIEECQQTSSIPRHPFIHELEKEGLVSAVDYGFSENPNFLQQRERDTLRELTDMQRVLSPYSLISIQLSLSYIKTLNAQCKFAHATPLASSLVERLRSEKDQPNHAHWLNVKEALVSLLGEQGRHIEAEPLQRNVLRERENENGPEHISTAATRNNLAAVLAKATKFDEALLLFENVLAISHRILGPKHPSTIITAFNRANMLNDLGRYDAAESQFPDCLRDFNEVFGPRSPLTFKCMNGLGVLQCQRGRYADAQATLGAAFQLSKGTLGPEHHDTLKSLSNLALLAFERRDLRESERLRRELVCAYEKSMGSDNPLTQDAYVRLATVLTARSQEFEAEQTLRKCLESLRRTWGPGHGRTLDCANTLVVILERLKQFEEATKLGHDCYEKGKEAFGNSHPRTLSYLGNYILALQQSGTEMGEICALQKVVVEGQENLAGHNHRDTIRAMNNLAVMEYRRGDFRAAQTILRDICGRAESNLGPQDREVFRSRINLAMVLERQGQASLAEEVLEETSRKSRLSLGEDDPLTVTAEINLGTVISRQNRWSEAEEKYRSVLHRRETKLRESHPDTVLSMQLFALSLKQQNRLEEAEEAATVLVERRKNLVFPDPRGLAEDSELLAAIQAQIAER